MPSLIRRVHNVLYPGWSTPERLAQAKNIRALRKEQGRNARHTITKNYVKAVKEAKAKAAPKLALPAPPKKLVGKDRITRVTKHVPSPAVRKKVSARRLLRSATRFRQSLSGGQPPAPKPVLKKKRVVTRKPTIRKRQPTKKKVPDAS